MDIGRKLRQLRVGSQLTQEELGDRTDLSKGFISQVENDQTSPSIETLIDILQALGVTPGEFFKDAGPEQVVYGKPDRLAAPSETSADVDFQLLVPHAIHRDLDPALVTIQPGGKTITDKMHEGEEFGYVISGEIHVMLGPREYRVRRGECFLFYARQKHYVENRGTRPAKFLWVTTPPTH
jgi:transcriptional regulator with XRE-family HTH domain